MRDALVVHNRALLLDALSSRLRQTVSQVHGELATSTIDRALALAKELALLSDSLLSEARRLDREELAAEKRTSDPRPPWARHATVDDSEWPLHGRIT